MMGGRRTKKEEKEGNETLAGLERSTLPANRVDVLLGPDAGGQQQLHALLSVVQFWEL
jgi:hypothetical protein